MISCGQQSQPRLLFSSLVVLLIFMLSGCNSDDGASSNTDPTPNPTTVPTLAPTQAPTQTPTQVPTQAPTQVPTTVPSTPSNNQPSARITAPQYAISGQMVTLDGSGSSDPDGDILSYQWIKTAGPDITLSDSTSASLTFVTPSVAQATQISFQLTVRDGQLSNSASVSMQVTPIADNSAPSIVSRFPQPDKREVSPTTQISAIFNEALLESSINSQSLVVSQNGNQIAGSVSYDSSRYSVTFQPTSALSAGVSYTVTLANNITDVAGNAFAGAGWSFTTGVCATAEENTSLTLSCPTGQVIKEVTFASYGTPGGTCGSFTTGACNASNSMTVVANACTGMDICTLNASNDTFGEPCSGMPKKLSAQVACGVADTNPVPDCKATNDCVSEIASVAFSKQMGVGWNAGNSLDAVGGETAWGNPLLTQQLFNSVKAAGFGTVRLPVAWSVFSDEANFTIDNAWMERVKQVVGYALNADLYVIINIHWDGGWMQPTYAKQEYVNNRLAIMWKQIATNFSDYDNRLLFAGTNEIMVENDYGTPTTEYYTVQNSFNQTFVDTVRATGGKNANRFLIVQGFNTNIDHTVNFATLPSDTVADRLMMEVHYYDPYNFTLNTSSSITQWGSIATDANAVEAWANESWTDSQFQKMKSNFVDKGVAVILGEFGVVSRLSIPEHERYRVYWNKYISKSAIDHGLVPVYWDNGYSSDGGMALFDRNSGSQLYPDIIDALVGVSGSTPDPGSDTIRSAKLEGYGENTTGGAGGSVVTVSTGEEFYQALCSRANDDTPLIIKIDGTINHANTKTASGSCDSRADSIELKKVSNVSLIGVADRGVLDQIGVHLRASNNIIIQNLHIKNVKKSGTPVSNGGDAIGMESGVNNVWVDHNTLEASGGEKDGYDSLIDMKSGVTNVSISYNHLRNSSRGGLVGFSDTDDKNHNITFHHNWYENIEQRTPMLRNIKTAHIYNNFYTSQSNTDMIHGINSRANAEALVENNYFFNSNNPLIASTDSDIPGCWTAKGNALENVIYTRTVENGKAHLQPSIVDGVTVGTAINGDLTDSNCSAEVKASYTGGYTMDKAADIPDVVRMNSGHGKIN